MPRASPTARQRYLIALGSNRRHASLGLPPLVVDAAIGELGGIGTVIGASDVVASDAVGASLRCYANAVAILDCGFDPPTLLAALKLLERQFGARRRGQRWRARVLDLDIVLWSGGCWADPALVVPHRDFRKRAFVLGPAAQIAPRWRDPLSGLSLRQLAARLTRHRPLPRGRAWSGP